MKTQMMHTRIDPDRGKRMYEGKLRSITEIAKMVNMVPDELITNMGDCHIYLNQIEGVKEQLTREAYPLPKLVGVIPIPTLPDNVSAMTSLAQDTLHQKMVQSQYDLQSN